MRTLILALCSFVAAPAAVASAQAGGQSPATQAIVRGVVRDATGGVIPGAPVTARNVQTTASTSTQSDPTGRYELAGLPAGTYEIQSTVAGFEPATVRVSLAAGEIRSVDLRLEIVTFLESVTVTRAAEAQGDVPQAITVVGQESIQSGQRRDLLSESLRGTPGLFVENRRNYSLSGGVNAAIRAPMMGFDMRGVTMLQDGIPLTTADGTTQPTNVDLGSASRIEVVRGPSSVLYGNAAGGVISVQTEFPSTDPLVIEPDIQLGSYGYERLQVKLGGSSGKVSYLGNITWMNVEGFRQHSAAEIRRLNLVVRHNTSSRTTIRGVFNLFDQPAAESASTITETDARNNPTSVRPQAFTQGWSEEATQGQGGVTVEHTLEGGDTLRATGWGTWRNVWNPVPFRLIDLGRKAGGIRAEYAGARDVRGRRVSWTSGLDLSFQRDNRLEFENGGVPPGGTRTTEGAQLLGQDESVNSFAPFVQVQVDVDDRLAVTGGVRYDYFDFRAKDVFLDDGDQSGGRTLDAFSPMIGVTYAATPEVNLYANVATAYQTPTTVELSNRPTGEGGFNDALEPEELRSVEVGIRGSAPQYRLRFEAAAYFSTLDNAFVELQRADEQTYFANVAAASRNGLELRVDWAAQPGLNTFLSYTYQDFRFDRFRTDADDFSGNREPGAPVHQLFLGASYVTPGGARASLQYRWVDDYPVNNANTFSNWAYQVVDARVGWTTEWNGWGLEPFLGIENLFDERYNASTIANSLGDRYYEPSPGREFYMGLTVRPRLR